jgi:uncharacterized protein YdeI (YjbR/CyaY-like superfamily)
MGGRRVGLRFGVLHFEGVLTGAYTLPARPGGRFLGLKDGAWGDAGGLEAAKMNGMSPKVDGYVRKNKRWGEELQKLRGIVLDCGLTEEVKWRVPVYTMEGRNVVILGAFKEYCACTFVKGVLLKDGAGVLKKPGENTQAARVIRFTKVGEIAELEAVLKGYIREAMEVERAGLKVALKKITEHKVPEELRRKMEGMPALKTAFGALTPGRQRSYLLYIGGAKRSETREARVERCVPRILEGKGLAE